MYSSLWINGRKYRKASPAHAQKYTAVEPRYDAHILVHDGRAFTLYSFHTNLIHHLASMISTVSLLDELFVYAYDTTRPCSLFHNPLSLHHHIHCTLFFSWTSLGIVLESLIVILTAIYSQPPNSCPASTDIFLCFIALSRYCRSSSVMFG